jgi:pyruvate/2-oxoglutarate dehydrogenase complex dihydrolipoamide dehydrogenase (E3) component
VEITGDGGPQTVEAETFVVATGCRWVLPAVPGLTTRIVSPDVLQNSTVLPASAVVLGGGPSANGFAVEQAFVLAVAGVDVTLVVTGVDVLPGLDADLQPLAGAVLEAVGATVLTEAELIGPDGAAVSVRHKDHIVSVPGEVIVLADPRQPLTEGLGLEAAGVPPDGPIAVDESCRTAVGHIFAAGDVATGPLLSSAAIRMGEVAGANAAGGNRRARLDRQPRVLHTTPEIAWVGLDEQAVVAAGGPAASGAADLAANARSLALGARGGLVKVVADPVGREILGVHAVGDGATEMVSVAAALMQAEATVDDLAETLLWHPSASESLTIAARRATFPAGTVRGELLVTGSERVRIEGGV